MAREDADVRAARKEAAGTLRLFADGKASGKEAGDAVCRWLMLLPDDDRAVAREALMPLMPLVDKAVKKRR